MSLFPDVQRKAQDEISRQVGPDTLPDFDDYDKLVYVQAVVLETMRWLPVAPLAIPHRVTRDDEYRGMLIPEGSTVIPNTWAILRNPEDYPEPERFNPDRFIKDGCLDTSVRSPLTLAFGYGRRTCPGRWLSSASLFMIIASTLHTMDIHPILGPNGEPFDPEKHAFPGIKLNFDKLPCAVTPRSTKAAELIRKYTNN
ncbi:hypothetical protein QCA50_003970 [Cerrena zonata]|uniref:Cytochrome P450 n=1 Tax=Cerrena zonata TaxID=2478898 RepID=A0AAW0GMP1_9APHY